MLSLHLWPLFSSTFFSSQAHVFAAVVMSQFMGISILSSQSHLRVVVFAFLASCLWKYKLSDLLLAIVSSSSSKPNCLLLMFTLASGIRSSMIYVIEPCNYPAPMLVASVLFQPMPLFVPASSLLPHFISSPSKPHTTRCCFIHWFLCFYFLCVAPCLVLQPFLFFLLRLFGSIPSVFLKCLLFSHGVLGFLSWMSVSSVIGFSLFVSVLL